MAEVYDYNELVASQRISAATDNSILTPDYASGLINGKYVAMKTKVSAVAQVEPEKVEPMEVGTATELGQETRTSFDEITPLGESAPDLSATQVFDIQSLAQEAPVIDQATVESAPALSPVGEQPIFEPIALEPMNFANLETPTAEGVKEETVIPETPVYETQAPVMEVETPVSESTEDVSLEKSLDEKMPITLIAEKLKEQLIRQAEISGNILIAEAREMDLKNEQQRNLIAAENRAQLEFVAGVVEKAKEAQGPTAPLEQDAVSLTIAPDIAA